MSLQQVTFPQPEANQYLPMPEILDNPKNIIGQCYTGTIYKIDEKQCFIDFGNYKGIMSTTHLNYNIPCNYYLGKNTLVIVKKWDKINETFICNRRNLLFQSYAIFKENAKDLYCNKIAGTVFYSCNDYALIDIGGGYLVCVDRSDLNGRNLKENDKLDDLLVLPTEGATIRLSLKKDYNIGKIIQVEVISIENNDIICKGTYFNYIGKIVKPHSKFKYEIGDKFQVYVTDYDDNGFLSFLSI